MNVRVHQLATHTLVGVKSILFIVCSFSKVATMCVQTSVQFSAKISILRVWGLWTGKDRQGVNFSPALASNLALPSHPVYLHASHKDGRLKQKQVSQYVSTQSKPFSSHLIRIIKLSSDKSKTSLCLEKCEFMIQTFPAYHLPCLCWASACARNVANE